jgi:hypothetical protein
MRSGPILQVLKQRPLLILPDCIRWRFSDRNQVSYSLLKYYLHGLLTEISSGRSWLFTPPRVTSKSQFFLSSLTFSPWDKCPRNMSKTNILGGCATAQAVNCRSHIATVWVWSQVRYSGICGGRRCIGVDLLWVLRFFLPTLIPLTSRYPSIIWGLYNRPSSGQRTKLTQSHPTTRNDDNKGTLLGGLHWPQGWLSQTSSISSDAIHPHVVHTQQRLSGESHSYVSLCDWEWYKMVIHCHRQLCILSWLHSAFLTCASKFNFCCTFSIYSVISRHIKTHRWLVCVSCILKGIVLFLP